MHHHVCLFSVSVKQKMAGLNVPCFIIIITTVVVLPFSNFILFYLVIISFKINRFNYYDLLAN